MSGTRPDARLLAVVPARGGSRRVPRKNVRPLHGRPAIAYSIDAALESGLFARVVVSTDDAEIAAIAETYGAEVPFLRPASLADDVTPVSAATADALERLDPDGTRYDAVAQLMASCPLRTAADVRASHAAFVTSGAVSQLSVAPYAVQTPWWAMRRADDGTLSPLFPESVVQRSQDLPELVCPTGAVWWIQAAALRAARTYHLPGRTGWAMPWVRALDIDTEEDWQLAGRLLAGADTGRVPRDAAPDLLATHLAGSAHAS